MERLFCGATAQPGSGLPHSSGFNITRTHTHTHTPVRTPPSHQSVTEAATYTTHKTQQTKETKIRDVGVIRTHNPSNGAAAARCLRPGLANFNPQEVRVIPRDSPECRTCLQTYRK
jgi:hypothetical protein